jgi:hypothetical protein
MADQQQSDFSGLHQQLAQARTARAAAALRRGELTRGMGFGLDPDHRRIKLTKNSDEMVMQLTAIEARDLLEWITGQGETIRQWAAQMGAELVVANEQERRNIEAAVQAYATRGHTPVDPRTIGE